ncbi:hypothetical protein L6452_26804 [Arctium lappa]|uniref:Uncharacterized protein n=1 Tax=Arctium lappa TaxID=4217 RepID=A0ACB8ZVN8_ARCLA|nr:hypothetical protein L6452_26804 [Arctium lappa]
MSNKKMKRVAFDSSPHVLYEDVRARFKHQTLLQDFLELQQETEVARNKLMDLKQKKLTLQAQVRFLRRRHKFLLKEKASTLQEQVFAKPQPTQFTKSKKDIDHSKKQSTLRKLPPTEKKKKTPRTIPSPEFDLNLEISLHGVKEQSIHRGIANQRVRINGPKVSPFVDLTQKDGQEPVVRTQKPVIDLNQISREEEELQERSEPFHPLNQGLIQNGIDEQHTDVRLPIYRNIGSGSGIGRAGKRTISALRI